MNKGLWASLCHVGGILALPLLLHAESTLEVPSPPVPMGSVAYLDARNGFRDVRFGSSVKEYKGMTITEQNGDLKVYKRPKEDLKMGDGYLRSILYFFYKDELNAILLSTSGLVNSRAALNVLFHAYGVGEQANEFIQNYIWQGKRVGALYDENSITGNATITFFNHELRAKENADQNAKAKKAASGL